MKILSGLISPYLLLSVGLYLMLIMSSCSNTRKVIKRPEQHFAIDTLAAEKIKSDDLLALVLKNEPKAEWISAKANVESNIGDNEESFNVNVRIRKDSAIWVSINAILGVEAARIIITQDSIKIMDKIHNKYKKAGYDYLKDVLHVKVDFNSIQAVLLGNFFNYRNEYKFNSVYLEDKYYILSTLTKNKLKRSLEEKDPNKPVIQDFYIDPTTYRILSMKVEDDRIEKSIITTYEDFNVTEAGLIPFINKTEISAEKKISLKVSYSKMNFNQVLEMPFNIPKSYEEME